MPKVVIITNMPTGHQTQLFEALAAQPSIDLHVLFLRKLTPGRQWTRLPTGDYPHTFIKELRVHPHFYLNVGLFAALRRLSPDLIIVGQYASIAMQMVMYAASALGRPWVYWSERPGVEYTELPIFRSDGLRRAFRYLALLPTRRWPLEIWGIGERAQAHYAEVSQVPTRNLPYYLDLSPMFAIERRPAARPVRFLYSGKLNERKGFDLVLEAASRLARTDVPMQLSIMGGGPMEAAARDLAQRHPDRITFLGFKELDEVPAVLANHDVQLVASRYDGWGMVVPEGMAAGLAMVATDATGAAIDMIANRETGMLVEAGSASALFDAMLALAEAPALVNQIASAGRARAGDYDARVGGRVMAEMIANTLTSH